MRHGFDSRSHTFVDSNLQTIAPEAAIACECFGHLVHLSHVTFEVYCRLQSEIVNISSDLGRRFAARLVSEHETVWIEQSPSCVGKMVLGNIYMLMYNGLQIMH